MSEWQPIETVPKDEDVIVYGPKIGIIVAALDLGFPFPWFTLDGPSYAQDAFTHWMPLPEPPK